MARHTIDEILRVLNRRKIRATYGAVAELVGTGPNLLAGRYLGIRRPAASWVVSKRTGMPTGYTAANCDPDLQLNAKVIESAAELEALLSEG